LANVVANDIEHDKHVSGVAILDQRLEIRLCAKVGIEAVEIF
jgi:hypothetical protein